MSLPKFSAFLLLCLSCQFTLGATVSQEREELSSLKRNLTKHEQRLTSIESELQGLPAAIATAEQNAAKVEAEYTVEKEQFYKVKQAHLSSPTDSTERQFKLAEIKFGLAERRHDKAQSDLDELKQKQASLQRELATTENAIRNSRTQITRQERRLADAIETEERLDREAELARAEQERKERLAAAKPVITPPPITPPPVIEPEPAPPTSTKSAANSVELTEAELAELEFAKDKMAETENLIAAASDNDRPAYSNLQLSGTNFEAIAFEHLGNNQYRTDVLLPPGRHNFRIEDLRFRVDVPESYDSAQVYVFLADASDRNRLKASYFRKELIAYFDKEVVIVEPELTLAEKVAKSGVIETADGIFMSEDEYKEFKFAKEKMAETNEVVAEAASDDTPNISDLSLRNTDLGDVSFQYLGNQQYRADKALPSGRHSFRIERLRFNVDVPEAANLQDYIFIVDARDKGNLKASYFRKTLLDYADKNVAIAQ